jgi:outer membrane protein TolC
LKSLLGRRGALDPLLDNVQVMPLERIEVPAEDNLGALPDLVKEALAHRPDIAMDAANLQGARISAVGTTNGTLPTLQVLGSMTQAGLAGSSTGGADRRFVGGVGTGLGQVFRRDFPSQLVVPVLSIQIHHRQALADNAIDQLQLRQQELQNQKDANQVEVEVQNYAIALRQARARYQAAVRNRILQQQLLSGEREKLGVGASTDSDVVQQQRTLTAAQSTEIAAAESYITARVALDQALGRTLEVNHVSIDEARSGAVKQPSALPAVLPSEPPQ